MQRLTQRKSGFDTAQRWLRKRPVRSSGGLARTNPPLPKEAREKIRASKIGKPRTEAAKAAMRAGHARRRERLASEDRA